MKPIVVLGMAQPYPGYDYEQVTIVASRILDTIVAFGQTRHNIFFLSRVRSVGDADNFAAICEPIVCTMWDAHHLATVWASTACYGNSFTIITLIIGQ
jgi:hypothetical protein